MPTLGDITATHRFDIWNVVRPEMDNATAEAERFRPYCLSVHRVCISDVNIQSVRLMICRYTVHIHACLPPCAIDLQLELR